MEVDVSRLVFAVGVMIIMFLVFAWGLKLWAAKGGVVPSTGGRRLKLKETLYIDARNRVCLIEQDNEVLTVALGASGITLINKKEIVTTASDDEKKDTKKA